jgi:protein-disulfide isomerase
MKKLTDNWLLFGFGALIILIIIGAVFAFSGGNKASEVSTDDLVKGGSNTLGSESAKVKIVEFSDFNCPACKMAHSVVRQIGKEYGDKILIVFRYFPLSYHDTSVKAAEAAEAAASQGKFWEYHDMLFENQPNFENKDLIKYAKNLSLDTKKFEEELNSGKYNSKVMADLETGSNVGVSATPTFFINGTKYEGILTIEQFREIINKELGK